MDVPSSVILDPGRLAREVEYIGNQGAFVFDVETIESTPGTGDRGVPARNQVTWLGLATRGRCIQVPMGHPLGTRVIGETKEPRADSKGKIRLYRKPVYEDPPEQMTRADVFSLVNPLFADPGITKAAHGATFDNASIAKYRPGADGRPRVPEGPLPCTLTMRWLTDENRKRFGLKYVTRDVWGFAYDVEEVGRRVETYPFGMVARYLSCDAAYTWLEYCANLDRIRDQGLEHLHALETDLVTVLSRMRTTGVLLDTARLEELRVELTGRVEKIEARAYAAAGRTFNPNAVAQKQAVLFGPKTEGGQGLRPWKMTPGGRKKAEAGQDPDITFWSTDEESIERFRGNKVVDALLDYQATSKILGTYVLGYAGDPAKGKPAKIFDQRIYPDFVQYGTSTGRFSARTPNLQNVPRAGTELGRLVRSLFVSRPGWKLVVADYNQVELVILAHLAGKGALFEGFRAGIDPHTMTAAMLLGKDPAAISKDERQKYGKTVNFATVYGVGAGHLAAMTGLTVPKARALLRRYDAEFPEVGDLRRKTLRQARRHSAARTGQPPHVTTILGRKRRLPGLNSNDEGMRAYAERQAFNARIQGSSADLTKMAMIRYEQRRKDNWPLLLTVHDELVTTAPDDEAQACADALMDAMTGAEMQALLSVPLTADLAVTGNWANAK